MPNNNSYDDHVYCYNASIIACFERVFLEKTSIFEGHKMVTSWGWIISMNIVKINFWEHWQQIRWSEKIVDVTKTSKKPNTETLICSPISYIQTTNSKKTIFDFTVNTNHTNLYMAATNRTNSIISIKKDKNTKF